MHALLRTVFCAVVLSLSLAQVSTPAQAQEYGIAAKRPVFGGACKGCPWGILGFVVRDALKPYGYEVVNCWVCAATRAPRDMADKTKPQMPPRNAEFADNAEWEILREPPPDAILDVSATLEPFLNEAWDGRDRFAKDNKTRQNYRIVAAVQQTTWLLAAASKKSGITSLAEIKDRTQPTWIATTGVGGYEHVLSHYGITEEGLKAKGGGFLRISDRLKRAGADVFISFAMLANTPEQSMWTEVTQLNDLVYLDFDEALLQKLAAMDGNTRGTIPISAFRLQNRPIPTVIRSTHVIYVRDEAPDDFTYTLAKALDEQQHLFRLQAQAWYYDPELVAKTTKIPMHPGAMKYYRERGYVK